MPLPTLFWLALAFYMGAAVAPLLAPNPVIPAAMAALSLGVFLTFHLHSMIKIREFPARAGRGRYMPAMLFLVLLSAALAGAAYRIEYRCNATELNPVVDSPVRIYGEVWSIPEVRRPRPHWQAELPRGIPIARSAPGGSGDDGSGEFLIVAYSFRVSHFAVWTDQGWGSWTPGHALVRVTQYLGPAALFSVMPGERVAVEGRLERPPGLRNPGGFDYAAHLAGQGVFFTIGPVKAWQRLAQDEMPPVVEGRATAATAVRGLRAGALGLAYRARGLAQAMFERHLSPRAAALLNAIILGLKDEEAKSLTGIFARVGIVHLLAVSGLHVGYVALLVNRTVRLVGRGAVVPAASALGLGAYALLTGSRPPVLRASIMAGLLLLAPSLRRPSSSYATLAVPALILTIYNPEIVADVGYQLTVTATMGILITHQFLIGLSQARVQVSREAEGGSVGYLFGIRPLQAAVGLMAVSIGAQLGTLPVVAAHFHRLPWAGIPLNILAIPLAGFLVLGGLIFLGVGCLWGPGARLLGWCLNLGASGLVGLATLADDALPRPLPLATPHPWLIGLYYFSLLLLFRTVVRRRQGRGTAIAPALLLLLSLILIITPPRSPGLTVTFLDVGQGDASVLQLPTGDVWVVDAGPAVNGINPVAAFLLARGIGEIDCFVATHAHADHIAGFPALARELPVKRLLAPPFMMESQEGREFISAALDLGIEVQLASTGQVCYRSSSGGPGVETVITALHPPAESIRGTRSEENDNSLVLLVRVPGVAVVLMGDGEEAAERSVQDQLSRMGLAVEGRFRPSPGHRKGGSTIVVLKAGHHGSRWASTLTFLDFLKPEVAIISVGENSFGHPSPEAMERIRLAGAPLYRTDETGAIQVRITSKGVWVRTLRP